MNLFNQHHNEVAWVVVGDIIIYYHCGFSENTSVQYDEKTVFGSHGMYAIWTGTTPRTFSLSTELVAGSSREAIFNKQQVVNAYSWTQESPPICKNLISPMLKNIPVRITGYSSSINDGVLLDQDSELPIQISLSLDLTECKPI